MRFDWDDAKFAINLAKHGLAFDLVGELFAAPVLVREDSRFDYGETRWVATGVVQRRHLVCVNNDRWIGGVPVRWIIRLRPAKRRERSAYDDWARGADPQGHE